MRIRIGKLANSDLDEIWLFLAGESGSEEIATRAVGRVSKTFDLLLRFPNAGRSRKSVKYPDLRSHPCGDYLIYYRVSKGILQILRVVHGRRDAHLILSGL
jgi:toxin ParE1/3/4